MDELLDAQYLETSIISTTGLTELLLRFVFNTVVVFCINRFLYYRKSRRRDYYFTFMLISISIFMMIFLLGSVKLKIGFALGLFAIFGIIRYRTESMPVREMTYLFVMIAISVINALAVTLSFVELLVTNALFALCIWIFESRRLMRHIACKLVHYDRIELIRPDMRQELITDLEQRLGLKITNVEVGHVDFLRDSAMLKVYYEPRDNEINSVDALTRLPREGE